MPRATMSPDLAEFWLSRDTQQRLDGTRPGSLACAGHLLNSWKVAREPSHERKGTDPEALKENTEV